MFRRKRSDTTIKTIEATYRIDLKARGDMKAGSILKDRGFDSVSQLVKAYRGRSTSPARKRRIYISFHKEDFRYVSAFCLMAKNPRVDFDFYNGSLREAIDSENMTYVRQQIREMIRRVSIIVCLVGNGTASRDWVDWELRTAAALRKGICGVRINSTYGQFPPLLHEIGAPIARWNTDAINAAIECAAARRS